MNLDIQLVRHATLRVKIDELTLLVDPMLSDAAAMPPIDDSGDERRNPLVPLPMSLDEIMQGIQAVLVTHTHRDHWDAAATEQIPKHTRILCQPEDADKFYDWGFEDVRPIHSAAVFGHVSIYRTGAQHGTGELAKKMAPVSGYFLNSRKGDSLYLAGDSVWSNPVKDVLNRYRPQVTVLNTGAARFTYGDPITMTEKDVIRVVRQAPYTKVVAVHMESINHCGLTRKDLARHLADNNIGEQVLIPADGEHLRF
jgi:L-ascorbate metabolism protein UlaG (beta-lactamase superfamily)